MGTTTGTPAGTPADSRDGCLPFSTAPEVAAELGGAGQPTGPGRRGGDDQARDLLTRDLLTRDPLTVQGPAAGATKMPFSVMPTVETDRHARDGANRPGAPDVDSEGAPVPAGPKDPAEPRAASRARTRPKRRVWAAAALQSTWVSLRRNGPLTLATVMCAAVALTLAGSAMLMRQGVSNATIRWQGGVETIVFMDPTAGQDQIDAVGRKLRDNPLVGALTYVDQNQAYEEFRVMFRNSPELADSVGPAALPSSWRVVPVDGADPDQVAGIGNQARSEPGVYQVVYARDAVESVLRVSRMVETGLSAGAAALGAVAGLLVWTTTRASAWARKDEIGVMRTVGSPRWLIRAPFIAEGAVAGTVGALIAALLVGVEARIVQQEVTQGDSLAILKNFSVEDATVRAVTIAMLAAGLAIGAAGSYVAVRRHADEKTRADRRGAKALRRGEL